MTKSIAISMPQRAPYGAVEIIAFMRQATLRGFGLTLALCSLLFLAYYYMPKVELTGGRPIFPPVQTTEIGTFQTEIPVYVEIPQIIGASISGFRAGLFVAIPDFKFDESTPEVATVGNQGISSHTGGETPNINGNDGGDIFGQAKQTIIIEKPKDDEPKPDDIQDVDVEPFVDLAVLQSNIIYPKIAQQVGIQGKVVVNVLIGKSGEIKKALIVTSDNELLNKAAVEAVQKTKFTPALRDKSPVDCWVAIPINFKLK